jgi:hypothetical protein
MPEIGDIMDVNLEDLSLEQRQQLQGRGPVPAEMSAVIQEK